MKKILLGAKTLIVIASLYLLSYGFCIRPDAYIEFNKIEERLIN